MRPIHTMRPPEMIGTEQHGCADLGFCKAVSARRRMVGDLALQKITGVITASIPEPDCALGVHWDAAEAHHVTAFDVRYDRRSMIPDGVSFFPPIAFLFRWRPAGV
jgi:hypothetical protein